MRIVGGILMLALVVGPSGQAADDDGNPPDADRAKLSPYMAAIPRFVDPAAKVWTNADLERLGSGAWATTAPGDAVSTGSNAQSLAWLEMQEKQAQSRSERIAAAQAAVDAAEQKLANLERQLLATRNPFSARPQLSEDEREYRRANQETAEQRYDRTKELVDQARAEVEAAKANLQRVKAGR